MTEVKQGMPLNDESPSMKYLMDPSSIPEDRPKE